MKWALENEKVCLDPKRVRERMREKKLKNKKKKRRRRNNNSF